jgi:hypothetical protein
MKKYNIAFLILGLMFTLILGLQLRTLIRLEHIERDIGFIEDTLSGKNSL